MRPQRPHPGKYDYQSTSRPQHAITYPVMTERQKAAQAESIRALMYAVKVQNTRKTKT